MLSLFLLVVQFFEHIVHRKHRTDSHGHLLFEGSDVLCDTIVTLFVAEIDELAQLE